MRDSKKYQVEEQKMMQWCIDGIVLKQMALMLHNEGILRWFGSKVHGALQIAFHHCW